jgi:acyl-coenzyme A thioesterase PaaI-like protein
VTASATRLPASATQPPAGATVPEPAPGAAAPGSPLGSHHARCFGCGTAHPTGLHVRMEAGEGVSLTAEVVLTDAHQGAPGLAHGGLLATAFDEALSGLMHRLRRPAVTARLETDFLAPVPVGSRLVIEARCTGVAGRKVYGEAEARLGGSGGPVVARATSLFVVVSAEHFERHGGAAPEGHGPAPDAGPTPLGP